MFIHASNHQLMGDGQSPFLRVTFLVLNPPSFSKPKVNNFALISHFHSISDEKCYGTKMSYINEMDMSSTNHKMNANNIPTIYSPQITSQTSGSPLISKF